MNILGRQVKDLKLGKDVLLQSKLFKLVAQNVDDETKVSVLWTSKGKFNCFAFAKQSNFLLECSQKRPLILLRFFAWPCVSSDQLRGRGRAVLQKTPHDERRGRWVTSWGASSSFNARLWWSGVVVFNLPMHQTIPSKFLMLHAIRSKRDLPTRRNWWPALASLR